ncbi:hypothetical protein OIU78_023820 [Salix suchowensis]|nr:hypothetical protein OIU78_023820 [Salix suchowensis]
MTQLGHSKCNSGNLEPGHLDSPLKPNPAGLDLYPAIFLRPLGDMFPHFLNPLGLSVLPYGLRPREARSSTLQSFVKPFGLRFGEACSPFFPQPSGCLCSLLGFGLGRLVPLLFLLLGRF